MSTTASANEQPAPLAKKQKRGEDEIDFGGPMDDEAAARKKLEEAGFSPDNIEELGNRQLRSRWGNITPMPYFCFKGDLKMCRYLLSKGASTTGGIEDKPLSKWLFPIMMAAKGGSFEVCKWLYDNGAENDIRRVGETGLGSRLSPLFYIPAVAPMKIT